MANLLTRMGIRNIRSLEIFWIGILAAAFLVLIAINTSPIPYQDDYDSILGFLVKFQNSTGYREKAFLILEQHNDHRIAVAKIITLIFFKFHGSIELRSLNLLANFATVGTFIFAALSIPREKRRLLILLPAACIWFSFAAYEAKLWTMVTLTGQMVLFCATATFFFLGRNKTSSFVAAIGFSIAATLANGNGKGALLIGLILLLEQKRFRHAAFWSALSTGLICFDMLFNRTFSGYNKPFIDILLHPIENVNAYLSFFTFLIPESLSTHVAVVVGLTILAVCLFGIITKAYRQNYVLTAIIAFVILNGIAVAYRSPYVVHPSRYLVYALLLWTALSLFVAAYSHWRLPEIFQNNQQIMGILLLATWGYLSFGDCLRIQGWQNRTIFYQGTLIENRMKNSAKDEREITETIRLNHEAILRKIENNALLLPNIKRRILRDVATSFAADTSPKIWWRDRVHDFSSTLHQAIERGIFKSWN